MPYRREYFLGRSSFSPLRLGKTLADRRQVFRGSQPIQEVLLRGSILENKVAGPGRITLNTAKDSGFALSGAVQQRHQFISSRGQQK